jgi:anti-sigma factor RsiW
MRRISWPWRRRASPGPGGLACRELVELVTDYFEGSLSSTDRRRFEEHVARCGGCQAYLDQMRTTIRLAGRLTEESIPPRARDRLLAAFRGWQTS